MYDRNFGLDHVGKKGAILEDLRKECATLEDVDNEAANHVRKKGATALTI